MLKRLTIDNYALIDHLDISFPDGLIIITGETGAGKSILLGALSLLLGAKADSSVISDKERNCVVEGEFDISGSDVDSGEIPLCGTSLIFRRVISSSGRSRSFINDEPVSVATLSALSSHLVDIHAQHNHLLLSDENYQISILDYFAANGALLAEYRKLYEEHGLLLKELEDMRERAERLKGEVEYKQYQLDKIEQASITDDNELEELKAEYNRLSNAEQIAENLYGALSSLRSQPNSVVQNLKDAAQLLRKCYTFVPDLEEIANRLESCRVECKDIEAELEGRLDKSVASPEELSRVEQRIDSIESLLKRYNLSSVKELACFRDGLRSDIEELGMSGERISEMEGRVGEIEKKLKESAGRLSGKRRECAPGLTNAILGKLRPLGMPQSRFEIEISGTARLGVNGSDKVNFLFCANAGGTLQSLAKVASGGELSRIMLCLKDIMARYKGMPTMVFDEIDTGVSGSIADKMGELIGEMGENMQVFAITHLPQIAVKGKSHLLVYKEEENGKTVTKIRMLDKNERVMEIARMLSGSVLSDAAIENAKFLLENI